MLVCLDPGHGGTDTGAVAFSLAEKDVCLDIAFRVRKKLLEYDGIRVAMTRCADVELTPEERSRFANEQKADLFLSFHTPAFTDPAVSGFATYVSVVAGHQARRIQCWLHNQIVCFLRRYDVADLGKKNDTESATGKMPELRLARMPAIVLAALLFSQWQENSLLTDPEFLDRYAGSVAEGVARIYQCRRKEGASV
jgi:N-acetylmuramoyl-L-alanine amidase